MATTALSISLSVSVYFYLSFSTQIHAWDGVNSSDDDNDSNSNYTGGGDSVAGSLFNGVNNSGGEMNDKTVFNRARVGPDLSKEESDKVRMLGCWLFGTALRL